MLSPNYLMCMKGHCKAAEGHEIKSTLLGFPYKALHDWALLSLLSHTSYHLPCLVLSAHHSKLLAVPCMACLHALNLLLFAQLRYHLPEASLELQGEVSVPLLSSHSVPWTFHPTILLITLK